MAIITAHRCIVLYPTLVMELKVSLNLGTQTSLEHLNKYSITCLQEVGPVRDEIFGSRYVGDDLCYQFEFQDGTADDYLRLTIHSLSLNLCSMEGDSPSRVYVDALLRPFWSEFITYCKAIHCCCRPWLDTPPWCIQPSFILNWLLT